MTKPLKLAIAIPCYGGQICVQQSDMWIQLGAAFVNPRWYGKIEFLAIMQIEGYGIDRARNRALVEGVNMGADWLLMIDADTWVLEADALLRMIHDAAIAQVSVVSAPVRVRSTLVGDTRIAAYYNRPELSPKACAPSQLVLTQHTTASILNGLQDVEHVGAACLAVNLQHVIKAEAMFEFTLSEDREFCRQMRAAGFRIALDGRVRTGHLSKSFPLLSER